MARRRQQEKTRGGPNWRVDELHAGREGAGSNAPLRHRSVQALVQGMAQQHRIGVRCVGDCVEAKRTVWWAQTSFLNGLQTRRDSVSRAVGISWSPAPRLIDSELSPRGRRPMTPTHQLSTPPRAESQDHKSLPSTATPVYASLVIFEGLYCGMFHRGQHTTRERPRGVAAAGP